MLPVHPGEVLAEEFLKPMALSQNRLALDIRVPARRINEIVHGKRRISPDTAPVSYTHLDVYKRQLLGYLGLSIHHLLPPVDGLC